MTNTNNVETPEQLPETDLGIDAIRQDIADLKKDAEILESKRVAFEQAKKTTTMEESELLRKEIESEEIRIEEKKKELLALIQQTRGELEILKGTVGLSVEKNQLDELEKEILHIQGKKKNAWEKTWNRVKENPGKTVLFATGVGLLARGIAKWIKKKKSGTNGENKESSKGKVRKRVLGVGAGVAAIFGIKRLYDKFKGPAMEKPETQISDFEALSDLEKTKYNTFGTKVNAMYTNIYQREIDDGLLNDANLGKGYEERNEKAYTGVVPFAMDKTYSNIGSMLTEGSVNRHVRKKSVEEYSELLKGYSKETLQSMFGGFLTKLESFKVLGYTPTDDISVKIQEWLVANPEEACNQLDFFFRQFVMTLTYLEEKKIQLRRVLVMQKINVSGYGKDKKKLTGLSQEEQDNLIEDAMDDDKWMESVEDVLVAQFDHQKISTLETTLAQYEIYDEKISADLQQSIDSLDEDRDDLLAYDEDLDSDVLDRAENDIQDGSLEKTTQEELSVCTQDVIEDAIDENGEGFMQMYFEPLAIACNMDAAAREKFLEESGGRELLNNFSLGLQKYKEKIDAGTMTKEDVANLKIIINKYLAFKKEVVVAIHTLQNINSDNPDLITRAINTLWAPVVGLYECFTEKMPFLQWTSKFCTGMIVTGGLVYIVGRVLGKKGLRTVGKSMVKIGGVVPYLAFKGAVKGIKYAGGKMIFSGIYRERKILESSDPQKLFRRACMTGEISSNRALKLAEKLGIKDANGAEIRNINDLYIKYGAKNTQEAELIAKYMNNPKVRILMMKKTRAVNRTTNDRFKHNIYERALNHEYAFVADNLKKLQDIDNIIKSNAGKNSAKVIENMLNGVSPKHFASMHSIINRNNTAIWTEIDALLSNPSKKLSPQKIGKLLGKHINQFADAGELEACIRIINTSSMDAKEVAIMISRRKEIDSRLAKGEHIDAILKQMKQKYIKKILTPASASASADLLKSQDEIVEVITKESDALKLTLKNSNIFIDQPISMVDNYYKMQVDGLETFKLQVKSFTKTEVDAFKQLQKMKFKATHIAELFALGKTNPAIEAALKTTDDLDALLAVLKTQKTTAKIKVSDDLIKVLEDIQLTKVAGKYTDEMLNVATSLFKFVAKIT